MTKYTVKIEVEAVQYLADQPPPIAACHCDARGGYVHVHTAAGAVTLGIGDWIVYDDIGGRWVESPESFKAYKPAG